MQIAIKTKKPAFVSYPEIKEELILETKVVRLVDAMDARKKILFLEDKILNIIQRIRREKAKGKSRRDLRQETDAARIA